MPPRISVSNFCIERNPESLHRHNGTIAHLESPESRVIRKPQRPQTTLPTRMRNKKCRWGSQADFPAEPRQCEKLTRPHRGRIGASSGWAELDQDHSLHYPCFSHSVTTDWSPTMLRQMSWTPYYKGKHMVPVGYTPTLQEDHNVHAAVSSARSGWEPFTSLPQYHRVINGERPSSQQH